MFDSPELKVLSRYVRSYLGGLKSLCVQVDGEEWKYLDGGKGEAILFLHGATGSKTQWRSLMREYLPDYRVIALDVPGLCVNQRFRSRRHSLRQLGQWLGKVLALLRVERVHIVASSLGCALAAYFTAARPECVQSLTFLGYPTQLATQQRHEAMLQEFRDVFSVRTVDELQAIYRRVYFSALTLPTIVLRYNLREMQRYREPMLQVLAELLESMPVMMAGLRQIRVPTLVIQGDSDQIAEPLSESFWQLQIPQVRCHIIPQCGHMPHLEKPDEVLQLHRALLQQIHR